jgi:hypothetical protein
MSLLIQQLIVALLVVGAASFAAWRLASAPTKLHLLEWLTRRVGDSGRVAEWLQTQLRTRRLATGCDACSTQSNVRK